MWDLRRSGCSASLRHQPQAFAIVEGLVAVIIIALSIAGLSFLVGRQAGSSSDAAVLARVENIVANDLAWLKSYGKYWRMKSGLYNITCTQAGFSAGCSGPELSSTISYDPDAGQCSSATLLAENFVSAAGSVAITPPRPYPISLGASTLLSSANDAGQPPLPAGTSVIRTITAGKNLIYVSYSFSGDNAAAFRFARQAAVRPEASAWCP